MFSKSFHHNSVSEIAQMLTQLQENHRDYPASAEASRLVKDIDETIAHASDAVIKRALERAGLTSEEMVSLLQDSQAHIKALDKLRSSRLNSRKSDSSDY